MFKKKDHAMLEEAYNKVLMNEISSELPPEEEGSEEKSDKPKFGSAEWREMYSKGKKKKEEPKEEKEEPKKEDKKEKKDKPVKESRIPKFDKF